YARRHGISLGTREAQALDRQLRELERSDATTARLLRSHAVSPGFLRRLLRTETLVRQVETQVSGARATSGSSYHLRTYSIPLLGAGTAAKSYRAALTLATVGKPVPDSADIHERWVAVFRLPHAVRKALAA